MPKVCLSLAPEHLRDGQECVILPPHSLKEIRLVH